jgi:uncharacterized membrane protein
MKQTKMGIRGWVLNALVAAIYIVLLLGPASLNLASGAIQFRLSESLNHLVVFDRRYLIGVVSGVVIFNAIFSPLGWLDVVFGGGQSLIGLSVVAWLAPKLKQLWQRFALNIAVMTLTMALIAVEIIWTGHLKFATMFLPTYGSLMLSEFIVMTLSAPVMLALDRIVHFRTAMAQK